MTTIHDTILAEVVRHGDPLMLDLADAVGPTVRMGRDEVCAAVWDLIQGGRLDYGADARVRLAREGAQ